ncbi:MAG: hypothetical protein HY263_02985 [Chloroflexi bacterium]|nr:hypothetical protein [Chloroflexota bacterium]
MSFLERAKQAAEQARQAAADAAGSAKHVAIETSGRAQATIRDPATQAKARESIRLARKGIATAVERIDPAVLADVIIKATSLQERANAALRAKGSPYRISEIAIGAAIPPSITFSIGRLDDAADDPADHVAAVPAPVAARAAETITTLDGTELGADDLAALADES